MLVKSRESAAAQLSPEPEVELVRWFAAPLDVAFKLERDEWQGRTTLQARVAALAPTK